MLSLPLIGPHLEKFKTKKESIRLLRVALACIGKDFNALPPMVRATLARESEVTSVEQAITVFKKACDAIDSRTQNEDLKAKVLLVFYEERSTKI